MNQQRPAPTSTQCSHFWESVQDQLGAIAQQAASYLPDDDDDALDTETAQEILGSLLSARASADTAAGAYSRVLRAAEHNTPRQAPPQPAAPFGPFGRS